MHDTAGGGLAPPTEAADRGCKWFAQLQLRPIFDSYNPPRLNMRGAILEARTPLFLNSSIISCRATGAAFHPSTAWWVPSFSRLCSSGRPLSGSGRLHSLAIVVDPCPSAARALQPARDQHNRTQEEQGDVGNRVRVTYILTVSLGGRQALANCRHDEAVAFVLFRRELADIMGVRPDVDGVSVAQNLG
jgi:hypothetical protein